MIEQAFESPFGEAPPLRKLGSRRSVLEIRMDILTVVRDGAEGPTQIMYKANLSWKLLMQHMGDLVVLGILSEQKVKNRLSYRLTEKGIGILRSYFTVADQFHSPDHYGPQPLQ